MTSHPLARLLANILRKDLEGRPPQEVLSFLAGELRAAAGARRVLLRLAEVESGQTLPHENSPVLGIDSPAEPNITIPTRAGDLTFEGRAAVLGDLRDVVCENFGGPIQSPDDLTGEDRGILLRVRIPGFVVWAVVYGPAALAHSSAIALWQDFVPSALRAAFAPLSPPAPGSAESLRHEFSRRILTYTSRNPKEDYSYICQQWLHATKADWVSLWLYNSLTDRYELSGLEGSVSHNEAIRATTFADFPKPGNNGVGHYCSLTKTPVITDDPAGWRGRVDQQEYHIELSPQLQSLGCRSLVCVPLIEAAASRRMLNIISINYKTPAPAVWHSSAELLEMGSVSAQAMAASQMRAERAILLRLNELAQTHLTNSQSRPRDERENYLKSLIELIQQRVRVAGVSIFYRSPFDDGITCVASTGIVEIKYPDRVYNNDELVSVHYDPHEGYTGECFATAQPRVSADPGKSDNHIPKYCEVRKLLRREDLDPIAIIPIPPPTDAPSGDNRALGVIRCIEHQSLLFEKQLSYFDSSDVAILEFIAQQIGPVLQTFAQRIERESTVAILSHDLYAPLGMIRRTIDRAVKAVEAREPIRDYDIYDIQMSATLALNLAIDLDPEARTHRDVNPSVTHLEGDIIARLRAMMSSYAETTNEMQIKFGDFRKQGIPALLVDRDLIERAFFNVIINAVKYGKSGTTIEIQPRNAASSGSHFIIDVTNQGIGIEKDEEPHIFTPYYRSPRARKTTRSGVGLGLAIAKRCMQLHGGDLLLRSRANPTIFTFYFPISLRA